MIKEGSREDTQPYSEKERERERERENQSVSQYLIIKREEGSVYLCTQIYGWDYKPEFHVKHCHR